MSYTKLRQQLAEGLKAAYKISEGDIANILPEKEEDFKENEFLTAFLEQDKNRVEAITLKGKDKFAEGFSKAKKEVMQSFENEIRDAFGIEDSELVGIELMNKVVELNSKKFEKDPSKLTDEQLKSHPSVIKMLNEKERLHKENVKQVEDEFNNKLNQFNRERVFNTASKKALAIFEAMNPVLSTDPVRAQNQKNILLERLKGFEYSEDGEEFTILKDGKRYEDAHGHGVSFESLVKDNAKALFDFKQADPRDNPDPGGSGGGASGKPKNQDEYVKMITDKNIPLEERQKIREEWNKQAAS